MSEELRTAWKIEARRVARHFNCAAPTYARDAVLQQAVARGLIDRLRLARIAPRIILDLGSGSGANARALAAAFRPERLVEIDIALGMLIEARPPRWRRAWARRAWLCADAQQLPLASASADLAFSNLMLQWCNAPDRVFGEVARVLHGGGLFAFTTLGPDTLKELRESWGTADDSLHVNVFMDMHDLGDALLRAGLRDAVMETERMTLTYDTVFALMRDLKKVGARNAIAGRRRTLTGKDRLRKVEADYERWRIEGRLPATYEVIYGHAWGAGRGRDPRVVTVPLSAVRRPRKESDGRGAA